MTRKANYMDEVLGSVKEMSDYFGGLMTKSKRVTKAQKSHKARRDIEDIMLAKECAGYCLEAYEV